MKTLIRILKALSDPNRMRIMKMLQRREMCGCELTEALGISQPSVSRHMRLLEDADLVIHRRDGLWINYRVNEHPSNPYSRDFLTYLRSWLEEDQEIRDLLQMAATLDRESICGRAPIRPPKAPRRGATL